ncbi:Fungal trans [Geosmithia morbida]|uniref:Fungal trans n=1 Tax=Geosmithia morbida TaxID=1094350 RepID=A0A9P4YRY4_9HYPO|nr:Fungal trans [Geosmithia morbida]KAF4121437.1 Fungal trans [Geosmithia morbida]
MKSRLRKLEEDSQRLHELTQNQTPQSMVNTPGGDDDAPTLSSEEKNMINPLFDENPMIRDIEALPSSEPGFIGEASCAAFSNRLLQSLDDEDYKPSTAGLSNYFRFNPSGRLPPEKYCDLPERMHAKLLLNVARRFIGNYHPLFLEVTFMRELDAVYRRETVPSVLWMCKFYALIALGEVYTSRRYGNDGGGVPGTEYYVRAVTMFQESFEEPSPLLVEILTLLAWASNIFGRLRTAFCYSGTAMRMAMSMGMHRAASSSSSLSPVERESRRRTWWVLYFFERFSASKLGQPITVRDEDIDVELPSMDGLTEAEKLEFLDPISLTTNVRLARIIGNILTDIYGIPKSTSGLCIDRVHGILKQLRAWHDELPPEMRIKERGTPRPAASLHLAYNQCIILTTRPVLLHLFKAQFRLGAHGPQAARRQPFSSLTMALADSCVNAAQASRQMVETLFLDGSIASFGYWDAHHIFSAALILIMSAVMKPAPATSEGLETLLSILRSMKNGGNIPAVDFCERLSHIKSRVSRLRSMGHMGGSNEISQNNAIAPSPIETRRSGPTEPGVVRRNRQPPTMSFHIGSFEHQGGMGYIDADVLGNPLIESFLDETREPWRDALLSEDSTLGQSASEIEEQFVFHMQ